IHPAQKELIMTMAHSMTPKEIAKVTKVSERTIQRVVHLWKQTGLVVQKPVNPGRPRELDMEDVMYLESLIHHTLDMYLSELRNTLLTGRGIDVDESTVSCTLYRRGYTRKKVSRVHCSAAPLLVLRQFRCHVLLLSAANFYDLNTSS
ncbi:hypothetical protein F5888DRAFT_1617681, partial [Russula emetica]